MNDGILDNGDPRDRPEDHLPLGRVPDLPDPDYRADPGISTSDLKKICDSEGHRLRDEPPTAAMLLGTATHLAVFDPNYDLCTMFVCAPNVVGYKTMGTKSKPNQTWARLAEGNPDDKDKLKSPDVEVAAEAVKAGKILILHDGLNEARWIADAVRAHPKVKLIVENGEAEVSYFAVDPVTGQRLRVRVDWENAKCRSEFKTAKSATRDEFMRQVRKMKYHWQDFMYRKVPRLAGHQQEGKYKGLIFIVADKTEIAARRKEGSNPSEGVARYDLGDMDQYWMKLAAKEVHGTLAKHRAWLEGDRSWTGYSKRIVNLAEEEF